MEGKERERSKALALASAAFGDVVFGFSSEMPEEMDVYTRVATLVKKLACLKLAFRPCSQCLFDFRSWTPETGVTCLSGTNLHI